MANNRAAWLDAAATPFRVGESPVPKPGPDEIVIKNHALAINPADYIMADTGLFIKDFPRILGIDVAGVVHLAGSNVTRLQKGDRVAGHCRGIFSPDKSDAGFQLYTKTPASFTTKIPDSVPFTEACVIPLGLNTAGACLYRSAEDNFLGLPLPSLDSKPSGKIVLVWGGASSVGCMAIQLAVASGATVFTTASPHNFEFCRGCGATEVFDYKSESVVDDIVTAVKKAGKSNFVGILEASGSQFGPANSPYQKEKIIFEKLECGTYTNVFPGIDTSDLPLGIKSGTSMEHTGVTEPLFAEWIYSALEQGTLKCLPKPKIVGKGLESCQTGVDEMRRGVSATKLVIEM